MHRSFAPVVLLLAAALVLAPTLGAVASPAPRASLAADPPPITWAVAPSTATGGTARASFAYSIDPGTQINDYIAVSNFGKAATTFDLYATDATNDFATGAFGLLPRDKKPTDIGSWITVSTKTMTVKPGQRAIVPFTLVVPSDATPGDHTAGVIASYTTTSTDATGEAINLEQRVAARVYLRISGDVAAKVATTGLVAGFTPSWNPLSGGAGGVDYAVANTGNVRVDVKQNIAFTGPFGIVLGRVHPDPVQNILPGQSVHVHAETTGLAPLFLLWGAVNLKPGAPTDTVSKSQEQGAYGAPPVAKSPVKYIPVSSSTLTGAVSWILLIIAVVLAALIWLIVRYIRTTRENFFDAVDAATAEAREVELRERAEKEPVR